MTGPGETGPDDTTGRDATGSGAEERPAAGRRLRPSETEEPDFASEHSSTTVADEQPGGPEHVPEPESPADLAGQDPGEA